MIFEIPEEIVSSVFDETRYKIAKIILNSMREDTLEKLTFRVEDSIWDFVAYPVRDIVLDGLKIHVELFVENTIENYEKAE